MYCVVWCTVSVQVVHCGVQCVVRVVLLCVNVVSVVHCVTSAKVYVGGVCSRMVSYLCSGVIIGVCRCV